MIVADDDVSVREQVRRALNDAPDLELIATARDGAEAWRYALELSPDVLVLDDTIVDGLGLLARLREEAPDVRIVMYVENPTNCIEAAEMGADGCVAKDWPLDALLSMIRRSGTAARNRL
ncbi:MAG: response regulator transcription factor [Chloroflexota bacterium]|nr:response regulator transcription factor [Chloroflexota bacterium]